MIRCSSLKIALVALLGLAACGGDDAENDRAQTAAGDVARYCALTKELDSAGEMFFSGLGQDASPEEFQAAERRFIEHHSDDLDELRAAAPARLKPDVDKLLAGMHQRAGLKSASDVSEREASAAEERIRAFEKRECD
jgi:hypothetical protein